MLSRIKNKKAGFSLIELIVVISIFVMLTTVTMSSYPKFSNRLSLDLLAQDVALSLRQAQIAGSSVLGIRGVSGQVTRSFGAYGVHFEMPDYVNYPGQYLYTIFADIPTIESNIRRYNGTPTQNPNLPCLAPTVGPPPEECLQKFLITGRNKVKALCANYEKVPASERFSTCWANAEHEKLSKLDVVFVRPNLDAVFYAENDVGDQVPSLSNVGIVLESSDGSYRKTIVVWKTGQISVE